MHRRASDLLTISQVLRTEAKRNRLVGRSPYFRVPTTSVPSSSAIGSSDSVSPQSVFNMCDERSEVETLREIYYLTHDAVAAGTSWRKLLALGDSLEQQLKRRLLWVWPTSVDLDYFNQLLSMHGIRNVLSIGCGTGLLEWLITAAGGRKASMFGLEVDRNWWQSKYSVRSFIPLNYAENSTRLDADFLNSCCDNAPPCALLFCYFNNRRAFLEYLEVFRGRWIILIGPQPALGIHTDPNPIQPQLPVSQWTLRELLNWTDRNVVAFYEKISLA